MRARDSGPGVQEAGGLDTVGQPHRPWSTPRATAGLLASAVAQLDLHLIAQRPHHQAHLAPVAQLVGDWTPRRAGPDSVALVASYGDLAYARRRGYRRIVLMQHGAGQSYGGDRRTAHHPAYPGGDDNDDVGLFIVPNQHAADRWRERYPAARVEVAGCPRLAVLPRRAGSLGIEAAAVREPTVAVSFHWNYHGIPEMRSAFDWYRGGLAELARQYHVIGHAHPKRRDLAAWYPAHGIEYVADFDEVLRRADVYVCDNSSSMFEFATTGRPVVVLSAPWYRRGVQHGLRFWEASGVGVGCEQPAELGAAVQAALEDGWVSRRARELALDRVYHGWRRPGAAVGLAAGAILGWAA